MVIKKNLANIYTKRFQESDSSIKFFKNETLYKQVNNFLENEVDKKEKPNIITPDYVTGFADGEGCFAVRIVLQKESTYGCRF